MLAGARGGERGVQLTGKGASFRGGEKGFELGRRGSGTVLCVYLMPLGCVL